MAKIVFAAGMSHGPMLALEPKRWIERATDEVNSTVPMINKMDGTLLTYAQYYEEVGDKFNDELTLENYSRKSVQCHAALDRLAKDFKTSRPDVVIIIGNDQRELFGSHNSPAVAIFSGPELATYKRLPDGMPSWRIAVSEAYGMDEVHRFPGDPEAANEIIGSLIEREFDVAVCESVPEPERLGFGHAWGFVAERIFGDDRCPIIPIMINTIFPPNVPTPARCYKLGSALKEAIGELADDLRVAVIASGGLSHFICEEEYDRRILDAIVNGDAGFLQDIPAEALTSGSSETRSWIVLASVVDGLQNQWLDYIPIRRTPAGTGQGMGFGVWR